MGLFTKKEALTPPSVQNSILEQLLLFCRKTKGVYLPYGLGAIVVCEGRGREPNLQPSTEAEVRKEMNWSEEELLSRVVDAVQPMFVTHINDKSDLAPYYFYQVMHESEMRLGRQATLTRYKTLKEIEEYIFLTAHAGFGYMRFSVKDEARAKTAAEKAVGSFKSGDYQAAKAWFLEKLRQLSQMSGFITFVFDVVDVVDDGRNYSHFVSVKAMFKDPDKVKTVVLVHCNPPGRVIEDAYLYGVR